MNGSDNKKYLSVVVVASLVHFGLVSSPLPHKILVTVLLSHSMPQGLQNVIRKKRGPAPYWTSEYNHVLNRAINIFEKFHVKIKFWSKVNTEHEIRGTNFWDTLYISFIEIKNLIKNLQLYLALISL